MPISKRYECILAAPLNRAVVEREVLRRLENLVPPPTPRVGGGFVYLTMDSYLSKPDKQMVLHAGYGEEE